MSDHIFVWRSALHPPLSHPSFLHTLHPALPPVLASSAICLTPSYFAKYFLGPNQIIESVVGILLFMYLLIVFSFHEKAKWRAKLETVGSKVNLFLLIKVILKGVRLRSTTFIN